MPGIQRRPLRPVRTRDANWKGSACPQEGWASVSRTGYKPGGGPGLAIGNPTGSTRNTPAKCTEVLTVGKTTIVWLTKYVKRYIFKKIYI